MANQHEPYRTECARPVGRNSTVGRLCYTYLPVEHTLCCMARAGLRDAALLDQCIMGLIMLIANDSEVESYMYEHTLL